MTDFFILHPGQVDELGQPIFLSYAKNDSSYAQQAVEFYQSSTYPGSADLLAKLQAMTGIKPVQTVQNTDIVNRSTDIRTSTPPKTTNKLFLYGFLAAGALILVGSLKKKR